ncbi:hypothetical protein C9374_008112 [Naegleria lovaniensis]|uniref:RNA-dependent RNA polymerase n=1 Tax=Naegleria lovaniensis TaxID=51637 RepID=A0AA88GLP1_NAELO|nr:uncharacterized protein C9374_008112 [Naegleria lovaniensis]KAG2378473.1 hypothetical protein C9374_008112 [Naegleria lovaniensis]
MFKQHQHNLPTPSTGKVDSSEDDEHVKRKMIQQGTSHSRMHHARRNNSEQQHNRSSNINKDYQHNHTPNSRHAHSANRIVTPKTLDLEKDFPALGKSKAKPNAQPLQSATATMANCSISSTTISTSQPTPSNSKKKTSNFVPNDDVISYRTPFSPKASRTNSPSTISIISSSSSKTVSSTMSSSPTASSSTSNEIVEFGTVDLKWIATEIGNFEDSRHTTFRIVKKDNTSGYRMPERSLSKLFWKLNGDMKWQAVFSSSEHEYWMDIRRSNIKRVIVYKSEMAIELVNTPFVYRKKPDEPVKARMAAPFFSQKDSYSSLWLNNFKFGRSIVIQLPSTNIKSLIVGNHYPYPILYRDERIQYVEMDVYLEDGVMNFHIQDLSFNTVYLLFCVTTKVPGLLNSMLRLEQIRDTIVQYINEDYALEWIDAALRDIINDKDIYPNSFMDIFKQNVEKHKFKQTEPEFSGQNNMFTIRKIMVTPTGVKYVDKTVEGGNRVLRKYKDKYEDYFLRVTFCDEDQTKLSAEKFVNLHNRIDFFVKKGFYIHNRLYEMLAYSNSQLRSHSAWFVCAIDSLSPKSIVADLGNFSHIKVVAKYAARIGQCFSHTYEGIEKDFDVVPDICRNGKIFTDGVGRISPKFALELADKFQIGYCGKQYIPSAFQFRLGGYKGVVQVDPFIQTLTNKDLLLSQSQQKFTTESSKEFEIIVYSKRHRYASLNRQVIALLSSNGLSDKAFLDLLEQQLDEVRHLFENKKYVKRILRKAHDNIIGNNLKKIIGLNYLDKEMDLSSLGKAQSSIQYFFQVEPLFCKVVSRMLKSRLSDLKSGRLMVDKSSLLMGVVDFYNVLEEDEVFIQLSALDHANCDIYEEGCYENGGIVTGEVAISRNPCLHPGDIRKFKAVDDPEKIKYLSHLKDVVVFSQRGNRPQPNKLSGGDLDGDLFYVCWEPRLLEFEEYPPMDYEPLPPVEKHGGCDYKAIREFLTEYIVNDNLGVVAFLHLEHYDKEKEGAKSAVCLDLAKYHSYQVDYAKSGVRKALPLELLSDSRPHYMPKVFGKSIYHSDDILGKIYDRVKWEEQKRKKLKLGPEKYGYDTLDHYFTILDKLFVTYKPLKQLFVDYEEEFFDLDQDILKAYADVTKIYENYKRDLRKLMFQYYIESEVDLLAGFFNAKDLEVKCGKNHYKLRMEISDIVMNFTKYYHKESMKAIMNNSSKMLSRKEVAALFYVVVRNDNRSLQVKECFGISFYWLVMDIIVSKEKEQTSGESFTEPPVVVVN